MTLKVRVKPVLPAQIVSGNAIDVDYSGGVFTTNLDIDSLTEQSSISSGERDNLFYVVWDSVNEHFRKVDHDTLLSMVSDGIGPILVAISELSPSDNKAFYFTGADTVDLYDLSPFARTLLDDTTAGTARGTLELETNSTDNAVVRFDGSDGATQDSAVLIDNSGNVLLPADAAIDFDSGDVALTHSANALTLTGGVLVLPSAGLQVGSSVPFTDSAGSLTLQNIDAVDSTTIATLDAALAGSGGFVSAGHINGLTTGNNGTDADHDIDIATGEAASDDSAPLIMRIASAITKRIDASWAVGTGNGGLDGTESSAGTPDADTWYYLWLIMRSDTGVVDALYSESSSSPTMPTNYDHKRLIGAVKTDGSANILAYQQIGDFFLYSVPIRDVNVTNLSTAVVDYDTSAPPVVGVMIDFNVQMARAAGVANVHLASGLTPDASVTSGRANLVSPAGGAWIGGKFTLHVNGSGRIKAISDAASTNLTIDTNGFWFPR